MKTNDDLQTMKMFKNFIAIMIVEKINHLPINILLNLSKICT